MNISEEIKRMMSLLESEMGNVKPLINEVDELPVTPVDGAEGILMKAINTGCWKNKGYVWNESNPITYVNPNYLYALNKIDPNIKTQAPFVKIKNGDVEYYMFGILSTDPQYSGNYLAVGRNSKIIQDQTKPDPNQNYLESHGWNCAEFKETQNLTSQAVNLSANQERVINTLATDEFIKRIGGKISTTKALGADANYQTIDLATGINITTGKQEFNANDMAAIKDAGFSPAGKYFVYKYVGANTVRTNVPEAVQKAINYLGFTIQEPSDVLGGQSQSTTLGEVCNTLMKGRCNQTILDYMDGNPNQKLWPMSKEQKAKFELETKTQVFDQKKMVSGIGATKGELRRGAEASKAQFANRKFCNTGIDILTYCSTYSTLQDSSRCQGYMEDLELRGAITFPDPNAPFEGKIIALKNLLKDCAIGVQKKEINIARKYEMPFLELQRSSSPYGMRTEGPKPTNTNAPIMYESLNNSIKSVISETINKNNNKNLDSIIKKNLRKYIR
jgi:hypothetical protein